MSSRLPGAADITCPDTSDGGTTRCTMALTVVSSTKGRVSFVRAVSSARVVMRRATTAGVGDTRS